MPKAKGNTGAFFLLAILLILIAVGLVLIVNLQTDTVADVLENNQLLNILFILEDEGQPLFTDLLLYYPGSERGALFDIPGNTGMIYKSLGRVDRIDAVYREKGLNEYRTEIEAMCDIKIPFTVVMNLEQFSTLTDLLGGLRVFIPSPVDVQKDDERFLLPSGSVLLDGGKIVTYAKYVNPEESQADVQERMQNLMLSFLTALSKKSSFMLNKTVFPLFVKNMQTNADKEALFKLLSFISALDTERLTPQSITGKKQEVGGNVLLFPDFNGKLIQDIFKQTMSSIVSASDTAHSRVYVLEVLNGTATQNLARDAGILFRSFGYDVLNVGNADSTNYQETVIIDHIGNAEVAGAVAEIINCKNIETDEVISSESFQNDDSLVDFTIILGRDFNGRSVN